MILSRKGFTLVELLIVLAIIGVLAAVVLPRLQDARDEGQITRVKSELTIIGKRASIEESSYLTYDIVCGTNGFSQAVSINNQINAIEAFSGETVTCNSNVESFAIAILLSTGTYWCVDSAGARIERATDLGASEYTCQ